MKNYKLLLQEHLPINRVRMTFLRLFYSLHFLIFSSLPLLQNGSFSTYFYPNTYAL
ncbi:hypothetical protein [Helicobacter cholecystus]|uniref:hypothetical protein n=1 Tax=Helicobacter cholecystus TaxID=45498 RepID=UPI002738D7EA|nr:hypothetical protein [Helicobacter cholecystus]